MTTIRLWAVFHPQGDPLADSFRIFKRQAIEAATKPEFTWKYLYRAGYRVKRITLSWGE